MLANIIPPFENYYIVMVQLYLSFTDRQKAIIISMAIECF